MTMTNAEALKKAHEAKEQKNIYHVREFDKNGLKVIAYENHVLFDCGGPYGVRLDDVSVASLRNFLSEWKNDKRTREQRKERRSLSNANNNGKRGDNGSV